VDSFKIDVDYFKTFVLISGTAYTTFWYTNNINNQNNVNIFYNKDLHKYRFFEGEINTIKELLNK